MQIEVGMVLNVKVTGITSFGAFVELPEGKSGLIHISEIASAFVEDVNQHLKKGQVVSAKVIGVDNGKISLSIKQLESGENQAKPERSQKTEQRRGLQVSAAINRRKSLNSCQIRIELTI